MDKILAVSMAHCSDEDNNEGLKYAVVTIDETYRHRLLDRAEIFFKAKSQHAALYSMVYGVTGGTIRFYSDVPEALSEMLEEAEVVDMSECPHPFLHEVKPDTITLVMDDSGFRFTGDKGSSHVETASIGMELVK